VSLTCVLQCRVLLNLRTTQPFEEVLEDLGQVLKMNGAKRMYTVAGQEVRHGVRCGAGVAMQPQLPATTHTCM
jgi:hypothetical protein